MKWVAVILVLNSTMLFSQEVNVYERTVRVEPSHSFDIIHYKIELDIDDQSRSLAGKVAITFRSLQNDFELLKLDAESYEIHEVSQEGQALSFNHHAGQLDISLKNPLDYGDSALIDVTYGVDSFYVNPKQFGMSENYPLGIGFFEANDDRPSLFNSYSFPTGARHWFPCYDHPNDRATHETIITTRKDHKVLANGLLVNTIEHENDRITYYWRQNQPHPTYLYNFVSGPYDIIEDKHRDIPVNYWIYPGDQDRGLRTFHRTPEVLDFFEDYYGVNYPWDKFDQIIVPGIGGGAEATTATLIGESTLHDMKAEKDYPSHWLVAHEAAHHWWGDCISYADWTETWLSESFATYSEYLYSNHLYGSDEGVMNLLNKRDTYLKEARDIYQRPIVFNRWEFPNQNFDRHTYQKGALVLHMLKEFLGEEQFKRILKHFLTTHAFQPVRTPDFIKSIWEITGQNMQWFFDQWLYAPGHPVLEIGSAWENGQLVLNVEQTQDATEHIPIFRFRTTIEIHLGNQIIYEEIWIDQKHNKYNFALDSKPELVLFDPNHAILKEWSFKKSKQELVHQVGVGNLSNRLWAIQQLKEFASDMEVQSLLISQTSKATFWAIRKEAITTLAHANPEQQIDVILGALDDEHSKVRTEAVRILGALGRPELRNTFKSVYGNDNSYVVQAEALRALGKLRQPEDLNLFKKAAIVKSPRNIINRAAEWALEQYE